MPGRFEPGRSLLFIIACFALFLESQGQQPFSLATYNLEAYSAQTGGRSEAKSPAARSHIRAIIRALNADVLALQEIAGPEALLELRASLKAEAFDYPHWAHLAGPDSHLQVGLLSRVPLVELRSHTNAQFVLRGRVFPVRRGFLEATVEPRPAYRITLITAHLKSRRPVPEADQAELRQQEARLLRARIDQLLGANPDLNLVVLGDLNDMPAARSTRIIIGPRGRKQLEDLRPSEQRATGVQPGSSPRAEVAWTYFYEREDSYSRIDYILISRGLARERIDARTYSGSNWGLASDHRPLVARFDAQDR